MAHVRPADEPLSGSALADAVIQRFPLPISRPFRKFDEALQTGSGAGACNCLVSTFDAFLTFLAHVALSAYIRSGAGHETTNRFLLNVLLGGKPALGTLHHLLRDVVHVAGSCDGHLLYTELPGQLFEEGGKPTESLSNLERIVQFRNDWAHLPNRADEPLARLLDKNRGLELELGRWQWLSSVELIRPLAIRNGLVIGASKLMGDRIRRDDDYRLKLVANDVKEGLVRPLTSVLLATRDHTRYLPLFPLLLFAVQANSRQGVFLLQRCLWDGGEPRRLHTARYAAPEADLDDHQELGLDVAASCLERLVQFLEARSGSLPPPAPTQTGRNAPEPHSLEVSIAQLPVTGKNLFGRAKEIERLDLAWADPSTHVLSVVAWGGVGKSALVNHWLASMLRNDYRGAERVFGWSFYSQGSRETAASADNFIDSALRWFGDGNPAAGSPWDKGQRLARLLRRWRTLLLLDGLEPLQYPPGPQSGQIRDPALATLIRELAGRNSGLCLITTRMRISDIDHLSDSAAPRIELDLLPPTASAALLRSFGVKGTPEELHSVGVEFRGHGLALTLLGTYLRDVCDGDVRRRDRVCLLEEDEESGGHARRIMRSYERWFIGQGRLREPAVLRLLGLFDRPAEGASVAALRRAPPIQGLTDSLAEAGNREWKKTLANLRRAGLLSAESPFDSEMLDTHPLVREHFGTELQRGCPVGWKEGHNRLYERLKAAAPDRPETLDQMMPLFLAVAHGCCAGRHREVLEDVYRRRIQRGKDFFDTTRLGAFGADLAALWFFFDRPWDRPVSAFHEEERAWLLNVAGYNLRALGRLADATEPMQAGLEANVALEDWPNSAISASNLCGLSLIRGELAAALNHAEQVIQFTDCGEDVWASLQARAQKAVVLHHLGRLAEAEAVFAEIEALQPSVSCPHLLYAFDSYSDLMLDKADLLTATDPRAAGAIIHEVIRQLESLLDSSAQTMNTYAAGVFHVVLGRARLLEAVHGGAFCKDDALQEVEKAIDELRRAGRQDELPRALLVRASLERITSDWEGASGDLCEAMEISQRGAMRLYEADCHLEAARLELARGRLGVALSSLAAARHLIEAIGYHRRDRELAELSQRF